MRERDERDERGERDLRDRTIYHGVVIILYSRNPTTVPGFLFLGPCRGVSKFIIIIIIAAAARALL